MSKSFKKSLLISEKDAERIKFEIDQLFSRKNNYIKGDLLPMVRSFLKKRAEILKIANKYPTPFYLLDNELLENSIKNFKKSFSEFIPNSKYFYAMKVNHHPYIIKSTIKHGFGVDVSSGRELEIALCAGAEKIVFSGPGKTSEELELAVKYGRRVIINVDSFREMEKLDEIASRLNKKIRIGVRIYTNLHGTWSKFGIPMKSLNKFWAKAQEKKNIIICGIQTHMTWNEDGEVYRQLIKIIAEHIKSEMNSEQISQIKFIDFGGGFRPYQSEGYYPWITPVGKIVKAVNSFLGEPVEFLDKYYLLDSVPISDYAKAIGKAIEEYLKPFLKCDYYFEPGRIICNNSMHIVIKIVDVKNNGIIIADGGINMVGWERYECDYFPLINLTNPSLVEKSVAIYGSLCMPQDVWGVNCYTNNIREGDVILVHCQ